MATDISRTGEISGFIGACLVDADTGLMLISQGGGALDLEAIAALNAQIVKAEREAIETLGLKDDVEDILITLGQQIHVLRPVRTAPNLFLCVALDRKRATLGLARLQISEIEEAITF